jgi:hypothetical protein
LLEKQQEQWLKRMAKNKGISEAEIVRKALDQGTSGAQTISPKGDEPAWQELIRFVEGRKSLGLKSRPYRWNRQDAYSEQKNRS